MSGARCAPDEFPGRGMRAQGEELEAAQRQHRSFFILNSFRHCFLAAISDGTATYSARDKEGGPGFKGFLGAPGKTKTIT